MAKKQETAPNPVTRRQAPARTPEARESQIVSLAYDLVEQRLRDGTATSQETTAVLRLGSMRAKLEREKLASEAKLAAAKAEAIETSRRTEAMMEAALGAIRRYTGHGDDEDEEEIF